MKWKLWGPLLGGFLLCALCLLPAPASAAGGDFGENDSWSWTLEEATGVLTITGTGAMPGERPWDGNLSGIQKVVISEGVTSIADSAFRGCHGLTSVELPAGLKTIGRYAFHMCDSLETVDLSECTRLTKIDSYAFVECSNLTRVELPAGLETIGESAFHMCGSLETVDLSECTRLTKISNGAFVECRNLTRVELPSGLETIEGYAFHMCASLASVELPAALKTIGGYAFYGCDSLTSVDLSECTRLTKIDSSTFRECGSLRQVELPAGLETIEGAAFHGCVSLESVELPAALKTIGGYAFYRCDSLTSVELPAGVKAVGDKAFSGCSQLAAVTFTSTTAPTLGNDVFKDCASLSTVYYPAGGKGYDDPAWLAMLPSGVKVEEQRPSPPTHVHSWSTSWSSDAGGHWHACGCGARRDEAAHTPGAWVVDQEASYTQEGQRHRACTVCGYVTETEAVPRREDSGGDSSSDDDSRDESGFRPSTPPAQGGGVALSPSRPEKGDTVTVFPRPKDGYEVESVTVTGPDGRQLEVRRNEDGSFRFTQPEGGVTVRATFRPVRETEETPRAPEWASPFSDVRPGDWYYEAVRFVCENELMNGYADGRFAPGAPLSRAQLVQILYNREGRPAVTGGGGFTDVAAGSWCGAAVRWAADRGIVTGYADGRFAPDAPVTREQLAVMLWRYAGSPAGDQGEPSFTDADAVGGYAREAVRWAAAAGVLSGYGDGRLNPKGQATRAQTAQMLKNYMGN